MLDADMSWWGRLNENDQSRLREILNRDPNEEIPQDLALAIETAGHAFGRLWMVDEPPSSWPTKPFFPTIDEESYRWLDEHGKLEAPKERS